MEEYTITLTEDRLKVNFSATFLNPDDCMITLHEVVYDSIGPREGFSIGDRLIAINERLVRDMTINEISAAFESPQIPLMLTLLRCLDDEDSGFSLSTLKTNHIDRMYRYPATGGLLRKNRRLFRRRTLSIDLLEENGERRQSELTKYIRNLRNIFVNVYFDRFVVNERNKRMALVSSNGFTSGYHEWFCEILKCDIFKQEIGVIGRCDIEDIVIDDDFISGTTEFGARAVFGDDLQSDSVYYASFDESGRQRIYKHLNGQIGLNVGDVVKVCLDLENWRVRFQINSNLVGKWITLQPNKSYFPCISFSGENLYAMR